MNSPTRINQTFSLEQAVRASPALAHLSELVRTSQQMLTAVLPLLPPGLRQTVQAGPLDQGDWCVLVDNSAAAAKLRQLLPALQRALGQRGYAVVNIRIKIRQRWA